MTKLPYPEQLSIALELLELMERVDAEIIQTAKRDGVALMQTRLENGLLVVRCIDPEEWRL